MDWTLCCICQKNSSEPLKCPLNVNGGGDKLEVYSTFLRNVITFRTYKALPMSLNFGEDMTASDLGYNKASWHKSCHNKFGKDKIERLMRKRNKEETTETGECVVKRNRRQSVEKMACLFCQQQGGNLHEFKTLEADKSVRQMVIDLQDTELMARIEGGDLVALETKYHLECLTVLRNRHRSFRAKECVESFEESQVKARALIELFLTLKIV